MLRIFIIMQKKKGEKNIEKETEKFRMNVWMLPM